MKREAAIQKAITEYFFDSRVAMIAFERWLSERRAGLTECCVQHGYHRALRHIRRRAYQLQRFT